MPIKTCLILVAVLATCLLSTAASADYVPTSEVLPAANACQGSLPQFAGSLRARPLGIGNEGSASAFITCAAAGSLTFGRTVSGYSVSFTNRGSAPATITCTGVDHVYYDTSSRYSTQTISLNAGASTKTNFTPASFGLTTAINSVQFNCSMPPDTEINDVQVSAKTPVSAGTI